MSFEVVAEAYDRFMGRYSRQLSPQLADLAGIAPGQRAPDVGSGPGALTAELVARLGAGRVVAVDPSESFVAAVAARNPGIEVARATADGLPFPTAAFDAALAQLVVHFMPDPVGGLAEMRRVTRPGGVVAACVWDHAGDRGPVGPLWAVARELDPDVHDESGLPGVRDGDLATLFAAAGLAEVQPAIVTARSDHPAFEDWWAPFQEGVGPAGAYVKGLQPADRERLREMLRTRLPSGPFEIVSVAWACRGVVP